MDTLALYALDLVAAVALTFGVYWPRHRRRDLVVALCGINVGVLAVSALGSLLGGFALGSRGITPWSLGIRLVIVLAGMLIALPMSEVVGLSIALFIAGLGTAPALASFSAIIAATVKFADTPEAYAWIGTGQLLGAAVGSAVAGVFIDAIGGVGGVWVGAVMVAIAAAVAIVFRRHQPDLRHGIGDGDGRVRPAGRVQHHGHAGVRGLPQPVQHLALVIGLSDLDLESQRPTGVAQVPHEVRMSRRSIDFRLPHAEEPEVGAIEDKDSCHGRGSWWSVCVGAWCGS